MNCNEKGEVALTKVIADLTEQRYSVYLPVSDHLPIDLIAVNGQMVPMRFQVKYRKLTKSGRLEVSFDSVVNGKRVPANLDYVDAYAIYVVDTGSILYVPRSALQGRLFSCSDVNDKIASCSMFRDASVIWED